MLIEKWRCERICLLSSEEDIQRFFPSLLTDLDSGRCLSWFSLFWDLRRAGFYLRSRPGGHDVSWAGGTLKWSRNTHLDRRKRLSLLRTPADSSGRELFPLLFPHHLLCLFHGLICFTGTSEVAEHAAGAAPPPTNPPTPWPLMSSTENKCHR